jgi:hypothetical protein
MIRIRSYEPGDAVAITRLHAESQVDLEPNVPEDYFADLASIQESFEGGAFVVAYSGEILVGMGGLFNTGEIVRMRVADSGFVEVDRGCLHGNAVVAYTRPVERSVGS